MAKIHEECGVFGIYSPQPSNVALDTYYGLYSLQHRGQESCGIVVCNDGVFNMHKDVGLVSSVFDMQTLGEFEDGTMAVGHVRYGTTGGNGVLNAQPIVVNHIKGHLALAHNGNLVNSSSLRRELELQGSIFHMTSDTEVISYIIIKERISAPSIEEAVNRAMYRLKGAYSLVIMSPSKLIAVRDENGFRPLCYGKPVRLMRREPNLSVMLTPARLLYLTQTVFIPFVTIAKRQKRQCAFLNISTLRDPTR